MAPFSRRLGFPVDDALSDRPEASTNSVWCSVSGIRGSTNAGLLTCEAWLLREVRDLRRVRVPARQMQKMTDKTRHALPPTIPTRRAMLGLLSVVVSLFGSVCGDVVAAGVAPVPTDGVAFATAPAGVAATTAVVMAVVAVVVMVVVGQPPSPGWQSGTSVCVGHGFSLLMGARVTITDLVPAAPPRSHAAVHVVNVYAQSDILVVVVAVVVVTVEVVAGEVWEVGVGVVLGGASV